MDDNVEDCPVCLTTFDDTIRRPRTLPCGHTLCTPCINELKEQGQVTCPTCRVAHTLPEVGQFPISYAVEGLIRKMRGAALASAPPKPGKDTGEPAPSPVTTPAQEGPAGLPRPIRSMVQEQETKVLAGIHTYEEVQEQMNQYQTTVTGWDERQQEFEDRLQTLMDSSKTARLLLRQEKSKLATKKDDVQQRKEQLHTLLQTLRTVATRQEAYQAIEESDHRTDEDRQRAEECRAEFPDVHTVTTINKVWEATSAAVEAAATVQAAQETAGAAAAAAAGDPGLPTAPDSSITDRLEALLTPTLKAHPLQVEDLRSLTQPARSLLQAGNVFAVHQVQGETRHARISLEDGRLYLHSLQEQPPPPHAVTVQMEEVACGAPPCLVFLDLAWAGRKPRKMLVRLSPDTPRGRQFILLCTGQRGPCYANTNLFGVGCKGRPGEWVYGGDYKDNNGSGGAALLPDLDKGNYRWSGKAGAVWGGLWGSNTVQGAVFGITTRDWQDGDGGGGVFGEVVEGVEVLQEAAQHRDIKEVTVVDCGVVLWSL